MKFAILALFGLVAIQAVELPTSDELVERRHRRAEQDEEPVEKKRKGRKQRRVEQDEEPVEKKRHGRKQRRADEDEMIEKKKRQGRKHRRADEDVMISFFGAPANQKRERNKRKCLEGWYAHQSSADPYAPYVNGAC